MAFPWTFADPVLGELTWEGGEMRWAGTAELTPKHRVGLLIYSGSDFMEREEDGDVEEALASVVSAARVVFQRLRDVEWKIRLDVADDVYELLGDWDAEGAALYLTLRHATLFIGRAMDLAYEGRGPLAGKRFRGYFDHLGGIEFADEV
jgi:hypothetical protein